MQFIKEADDRAKIKEEKDRKIELVKKEAVKNLRKNERKTKMKNEKIVTHLTYGYLLDILCHVTHSLYTQVNRNF